MDRKFVNSQKIFVKLSSELQPYLTKCITRFCMPIPVDQQIAVTMWRLATNVEYQTILNNTTTSSY